MPTKPPRKPQKPTKRRGATDPAPEGDRGARAVLRASTANRRRNPDPGSGKAADRRANVETGNDGRRGDSEETVEALRDRLARAEWRHDGPDALARSHAALVALNDSAGVFDAKMVESARAFVESFAHDPDRLEVALFELVLVAVGQSQDVRRMVLAKTLEDRRKANRRWKPRREFCLAHIRAWLRDRATHESGKTKRKDFQAWLDLECARKYPSPKAIDPKTWTEWWREARTPSTATTARKKGTSA